MENQPITPLDPLVERYSVWSTAFAACLLLALVVGSYYNTVRAPFIFDDVSSIVENPTIRQLRTGLLPPTQTFLTVSGRPLLNFSLALNYALGGFDVRGYHLTNLGIHWTAGLLLFGVVRRTAVLTGALPQPHSYRVGLTIAACWLVHPLQTESVTYLIQRAESLMAVFYLLTLYTFIRRLDSRRPLAWSVTSVGACWLAVGCKEVAVTIPLLLFLFDWALLGKTLREIWTLRARFYLALASSWLLLAALMVSTGSRGGTAGFGAAGQSVAYALTQFKAVALYLKLAIWPTPLVLDYGDSLVTGVTEVIPQVVGIVLVLGLCGYALAVPRFRRWGFCGTAVFLLLLPTSSIIPVTTQTIAEHRMYLPLAPLVILGVLLLHRALGRFYLPLVGFVVLALGWATVQRNHDYRSELAIWQDTAVKKPTNPRAQLAWGIALLREEQPSAAIAPLQAALRLRPDSTDAFTNLGTALSAVGRIGEAIASYEAALRLSPGNAEAHNNLGTMLFSAGRLTEAMDHYQRAVAYRPDYAEAHFNLGLVYNQLNRTKEAVAEFRTALRMRPSFVSAWCRLGYALWRAGEVAEAITSFERALQIDPRSTDAREGLNRLRASPAL